MTYLRQACEYTRAGPIKTLVFLTRVSYFAFEGWILDQVFTVSRILQLSRDAGVNRLHRNTSLLGDFPCGERF